MKGFDIMRISDLNKIRIYGLVVSVIGLFMTVTSIIASDGYMCTDDILSVIFGCMITAMGILVAIFAPFYRQED